MAYAVGRSVFLRKRIILFLVSNFNTDDSDSDDSDSVDSFIDDEEYGSDSSYTDVEEPDQGDATGEIVIII